ncbi:MAG: HEAT repeat domain-containing protein [Dehalococcoidales bacterium]|nr:HEAT repeat domain-containing protein [Dehalococcoidales bacterium]
MDLTKRTGKELVVGDTGSGLIADLGSKDKITRTRAHDALLALREEAVRLLVKALSNPNDTIRWEAARLLDEIGVAWTKHADEETINALISDLHSKDGRVRVRARLALVAIGGKAVEALEHALASKHAECRWEAAKALGRIGDPAATGVLVKSIEDDVFEIRWLATEGLIGIGYPALRPLLNELIRRPDSIWLREGAHRILHGIEKQDILNIVHPVLKALEETDAHLKVPFAAQNALTKLEDKGIK